MNLRHMFLGYVVTAAFTMVRRSAIFNFSIYNTLGVKGKLPGDTINHFELLEM